MLNFAIDTKLWLFVTSCSVFFLYSFTKATDRDPFDQLQFSIVDTETGRLFAVDPLDGTVRATQSLDTGEYSVNVSVTDGRHVRYAEVRLTVEGVGADAADSAVVVRLENILPEEFVASHLRRFLLALRSELAVREKDIKVPLCCFVVVVIYSFVTHLFTTYFELLP